MKRICSYSNIFIIISNTIFPFTYKSSSKLITLNNLTRESMINRNWILHGRDNPALWKKADALRLLNVLSTIQFIKQ